MTRVWRAVVGGPNDADHPVVLTGRGSFLGPDTSRRARWWNLRLECGHEVQRNVRYRSLGRETQRGGTQTRKHSDILPAPRRVRCELCPQEAR